MDQKVSLAELHILFFLGKSASERDVPCKAGLSCHLPKLVFDLPGHGASDDPWEWTIFLNYYLGAHYYGMPRGGSVLDIRRELDRNGIDAFIVWDDVRPPYLDGFRRTGASSAYPLLSLK